MQVLEIRAAAHCHRVAAKVCAHAQSAETSWHHACQTGSVTLCVCLCFGRVQDDLKLGKLLGSGGFGSVYKATLTNEDGTTTPVVVKKVRVVQRLGRMCAQKGLRDGSVGGLASCATQGACIHKRDAQTTSGRQGGGHDAVPGAHVCDHRCIVGETRWVRLTSGLLMILFDPLWPVLLLYRRCAGQGVWRG
jgi:hypothetical protein